MLKHVPKVLVGLALTALVVWALWPKPLPVDVTEVTAGPMQVTVDEEAKTRIKERYVVSAPLGGRVRRITLKAGDAVAAGKTLLAVVEPCDPAFLDARARATAQARLKAAETAREQAGPALERARANLTFAEGEHQRMKGLPPGGASKTEMQQADLLLRNRTEELKTAQFAAKIADFELEQARAALLQFGTESSPGDGPQRLEIESPIDGRVLKVDQESAQVVTAGAALLEIGDPHDLEVVVEVLSSDGVVIREAAKKGTVAALLEHWGGEGPLHAHVRHVESGGFTKISALGVEEQRVRVLLDFDDPVEKREALGDLFRVEARIVVWERERVVKVPGSALIRKGETVSVYRVEDGVARLRPVQVGRANAVETEVLGGLSEGDKVVAHPGDKVSDGVAVTAR
jgi:HlyD family secretion protein